MKRKLAHVVAVATTVLPSALAQAHHESSAAVAGESVFLVVALALIGLGAFVLQPRS